MTTVLLTKFPLQSVSMSPAHGEGLLLVGGIPPLYCSIVHGLNAWVIISWVLFLPAILIPARNFIGKK